MKDGEGLITFTGKRDGNTYKRRFIVTEKLDGSARHFILKTLKGLTKFLYAKQSRTNR